LNASVDKYLDDVCREIRYRKAHAAIRQEIAGHIADLQEDYLAEGKTREEASRLAIAAMGDPQEIGQKLHLSHRPKTEWSILFLLLCLVSTGIFALARYQSISGNNIIGNLALKQAFAILVGGCLAALFYFSDYRKLVKRAFLLYLSATFLLLIAFAFASRGKWFAFQAFSVDVTAIAFFLYLIAFPGLVLKWGLQNPAISLGTGNLWASIRTPFENKYVRFLLLYFLAVFASCLLAFSSLINGLLMGLSCLIILIAALRNPAYDKERPLCFRFLYGGTAGILLFSTFFLLANGYWWQRLTAFFDPFTDPAGAGYVGVQIHHILAQAKAFGSIAEDALFLTTDNGVVHYLLPNAGTDLIFTYIIAVFGWLFAIGLAVAIGLLLWRMTRACRRLYEDYAKLLAAGVCTFFALQFVLSLLMNVGLWPVTGLAFPFLSYGGSMMVTDLAFLGLFLGVYRQKDLIAVIPAIS